MWPPDYQSRLREWVILRDRAKTQDLETCLQSINDWWFGAPWRPYYLHWDDHPTWPGPWDLLADNIYCDLARALAIVYTILMIEHEEVVDVSLISTDLGNLVQINQGKYILNWTPGEMLNIHSRNIIINNTLDSSKIRHLLG